MAATPHDEYNPAISPDGKWIAFTGSYDGIPDVYLIPSSGGTPKRMTWFPSPCTVVTWTPDSRGLVFASNHDGRFTLYSVDLDAAKVQVLGVGISCEDVQLPRSELFPATLGSLNELLCSKLVHAVAAAATVSVRTRSRFLMSVSQIRYRAHGARRIVGGEASSIASQFAGQRALP